jgi:endonuclease YncB( thermonuclease family)
MRALWTRLLPQHQRIVPFWIIAGIAVAVPWAMADQGWLGDLFRSFRRLTEAPAATCRVNSIHDGDTLRAFCNGDKVNVRLHCIDAPEIAQRPWGKESRDYLRRITPGTITLRRLDTDRYGRVIGEAFAGADADTAGSEPLNLAMVSAGQAVVYPQHCRDGRYFAAQDRAREAGSGIWARAGDHQQPWNYRRARR